MGEPVEALSALCNGQIRPKPCRTPGWVCLSECCHGDDSLLRGMEHTLLDYLLLGLGSLIGGISVNGVIEQVEDFECII